MNKEMSQWLLSLYQAAREMPLDRFKDEVFRRLETFIPMSSAVWVNSRVLPDGGLDCLGMHLFNEPDSLCDEVIAINSRFKQLIRVALAQPGKAHSLYPPVFFSGAKYAQARDYVVRYGHQNLLITVAASPQGRSEFVSLYRSRHDDHFTPAEEQLMGVLMPHVTETLAIARGLVQLQRRDPGPGLAGTRALIQMNGVMLSCGERFKEVLRMFAPDWCSGRLPRAVLERLRPGEVSIAARDGTIMFKSEKLGDYLFIEARRPCADHLLSPREAEVARLFAAGKTYREVADNLSLRPATVRNVLQNVYGKLAVTSKPGLVQALQTSSGSPVLET